MEVGKPYLYHDGGGLWLDAFSGGAYALCQKVAGEYDHLPEQAFLMVGTIEDAVAKAKAMEGRA